VVLAALLTAAVPSPRDDTAIVQQTQAMPQPSCHLQSREAGRHRQAPFAAGMYIQQQTKHT
jgi:hypothetical protein